MKKHLVLAGAGHAHLTVLKHLAYFTGNGHTVTVISPDEYHYYSGMGPGMLAGTYSPEDIRFPVGQTVRERGGTFVRDEVVKADPVQKRLRLKSGNTLSYDVVSFNIGSRVSWPGICDGAEIYPVKPIENLLKARQKILTRMKQRKVSICVAGGGAAGVEIAANLRRLAENENGKADITLLAGNQVLPAFHPNVRKIVKKKLEKQHITVMEGVRLKQVRGGRAELSDGCTTESDFVFLAVGTSPPSLLRDSGIPCGKDGGLPVNSYLQSPAYPEIFGGGDCITFAPRPLHRVGVYAVRENPVLFHNLRAAVENRKDFRRFSPQKSFMLILNMGDGTGIFFRKSLVWSGRSAFWLKDHIDRRFMRRFQ